MPTQQSASGGKGARKIGRGKRKVERHSSPAAMFARGAMSASDYFAATGQKYNR